MFCNWARAATSLLFCLAFLVVLTACGENALHTNASMQEELENRDPSPPTFFLPEDSGYDCKEEHTAVWNDLGENHYQSCRKCGAVLSEPEKHISSMTLRDGYVVIGDRVYIVTRHLCRCRAVVESVYTPLSEVTGGDGE